MINNLYIWILIAVFSAVFLIFNLVIFPKSLKKSNLGKTKILDLSFGYSFKNVVELFEKLGEEGRKKYRRDLWTYDFVYPITYTCLIFLCYFLALENFQEYRNLIFLSFTTIFFDYIENTNTTILIGNYPKISKMHVKFASLVTQLKWVFAGINILLILIFAILNLVD